MNLVDGFAGGGVYTDPKTNISHPGSPTILLDAVRSAEAAANVGRAQTLRVDARFLFVDDDPAAIACLRTVLEKRETWTRETGTVNVIPGKFEDRLDGIVDKIAGGTGLAKRTIFILDQYGYTATPPPLLRKLFVRLPKAEIFLTLAVGWAATYLGALRAAAAKLGIARDFLDRFADVSDDGASLDEPSTRAMLMKLQVLLKEVFTTGIGSTYYTPFFIVSRESNRCYWFLHIANSSRANDVVKALHWERWKTTSTISVARVSACLGTIPPRLPTLHGSLCYPFASMTEHARVPAAPSRRPSRQESAPTFPMASASTGSTRTSATRRLPIERSWRASSEIFAPRAN